MMGCLAALSLAGCGGSGGGSSTVPSESLISEGYHGVFLGSVEDSKVGYLCTLKSDGTCTFYPHKRPDYFIFRGRWTEKFLGDGKFQITFDGVTGLGMTWAADGEPTKAPKGMVIKNGAYVAM